jgi:cytochrome c biogenesis protein CcdA
MDYKASKDMTIQAITIGIVLLFAFLSYRSAVALIHSNGNLATILIHSSVLIFLLGTLLLCFLFAPQKYSIEENEIIIQRPISNIHISIDSIKEIRQVDKSETKGMIRTFGVGGLFGNFGKFYAPALGRITMYATQNKNYVLIIANKRKIIITPDDLAIIEQIKLKKPANF